MTRENHESEDLEFRFGPLLIDNDDIVKHMMIFGATGSGKTTLIRLFLQDVVPGIRSQADWRMMITNPKSDALSVLHGVRGRVNFSQLGAG